ncbi:MAG: M18 family aminopeptidase [Planctomycetota bacterium]
MTDPCPLTRRLLNYVDASPTPFHAVAEAARLLEAGGFTLLREGDAWSLEPGGRYAVTRNDSTLIAFVVGSDPAAGFRLVGAHTDSPNLRLKPNPGYVKEGFRQLGVEVYGGVLLATWTDRDLSLAGRVTLRDDPTPRLLRVDRPLCRVTNIAIHLNREANDKGLGLNKQTHLPPLVGLAGDGDDPRWFEAFLARELGVEAEQVLGFDLMLYDVVPSTISGLDGEFIHAPRLDNLASCHAGIEALLASQGATAHTRGIALYDHEEVGSRSAEGAMGNFLATVLERIVLAGGGTRETLHRAVARSLLVSADMAHAVHPNYADKHEPRHMPRINQGPVIKVNNQLRYATNADTASRFERCALEAEVTVQKFVNRTDLACGSTIGPISAAQLGMPTVDVGNPMLSMHSVREMAGAHDQRAMVKVLERVFAS